MISINTTPKTIIPITELEQSAFCQTEGNLRTKTLEQEFQSGVRWQKVPTRYLKMSPEQVEAGIRYARKEIGTKAVVLGHHYQRDDVIQFADFRGDSYLLSKQAAAANDAKWIIFLRCPFHGRNSRSADGKRPECHPAQHGGWMFDGRHGGN